MQLERKDILQCYANRQVPNYLPGLIGKHSRHFTQYSLKPEFIKSNVFQIFQNIAGSNTELTGLNKQMMLQEPNGEAEKPPQPKEEQYFILINQEYKGPYKVKKLMELLKGQKNRKQILIKGIRGNKLQTGDFFYNSHAHPKNKENNQKEEESVEDFEIYRERTNFFDYNNLLNSAFKSFEEFQKKKQILDNPFFMNNLKTQSMDIEFANNLDLEEEKLNLEPPNKNNFSLSFPKHSQKLFFDSLQDYTLVGSETINAPEENNLENMNKFFSSELTSPSDQTAYSRNPNSSYSLNPYAYWSREQPHSDQALFEQLQSGDQQIYSSQDIWSFSNPAEPSIRNEKISQEQQDYTQSQEKRNKNVRSSEEEQKSKNLDKKKKKKKKAKQGIVDERNCSETQNNAFPLQNGPDCFDWGTQNEFQGEQIPQQQGLQDQFQVQFQGEYGRENQEQNYGQEKYQNFAPKYQNYNEFAQNFNRGFYDKSQNSKTFETNFQTQQGDFQNQGYHDMQNFQNYGECGYDEVNGQVYVHPQNQYFQQQNQQYSNQNGLKKKKKKKINKESNFNPAQQMPNLICDTQNNHFQNALNKFI